LQRALRGPPHVSARPESRGSHPASIGAVQYKSRQGPLAVMEGNSPNDAGALRFAVQA